MYWSEARTTMIASPNRFLSEDAARVMAGAVFRETGSRSRLLVSIFGKSFLTRLACSLLATTIIFSPGIIFFILSSVIRNMVCPSLVIGRNAFGLESVESGRRRFPLPPTNITAKTGV